MAWLLFLLIGSFCVLAIIGFFITGRPFKFAIGGIIFLIALAFVSFIVLYIWTENDPCSAPFVDHNSTYCQNRNISSAQPKDTQNIKCPEYYATEQERNNAYNQYAKNAIASNPNWTVNDFAEARANFLIQNNCTQTLRYIDEHGGMAVYKNTIIESITTSTNSQ